MKFSLLTLTLLFLGLFTIIGAGCLPLPDVPQTAQTLQTTSSEPPISRNLGFGTLPKLSPSTHSGTVSILAPLPTLPSYVTVLRMKPGTPNDTELRNLTNALGISDAFIGTVPSINDLSMNWKDDRGYTWTYTGSSHTLEGKVKTAPTEPVTLSMLPPTEAIIGSASRFLTDRGFDLTHVRQPLLSPDWGTWWQKSQIAGLCTDRAALSTIRFLAASAPMLIPQPPALPKATDTSCVAPEFPARVRVVYPALVDDRDVVHTDGTPVNTTELIIDASRMTVISARITPYTNPDRSDYPARSKADILSLLSNGGIAGVSGDVTITSFDIALLQREDETSDKRPTYLYPSLIAHGARTTSGAITEPVTLIVPLVSL